MRSKRRRAAAVDDEGPGGHTSQPLEVVSPGPLQNHTQIFTAVLNARTAGEGAPADVVEPGQNEQPVPRHGALRVPGPKQQGHVRTAGADGRGGRSGPCEGGRPMEVSPVKTPTGGRRPRTRVACDRWLPVRSERQVLRGQGRWPAGRLLCRAARERTQEFSGRRLHVRGCRGMPGRR